MIALLGRMFSRRWIVATVLVIVGVGVLIRLGIWQLDRLEQRRAFNARVLAVIDLPPLDLNHLSGTEPLYDMEYRQAAVRGTYDFDHEVALRNQAHDGQWGVNLITPLRIRGRDAAILVNRGWIPAADYTSGNWAAYAEPGEVTVTGALRRSQDKPDFGGRTDPIPGPGEPPLTTWNFVNVAGIAAQTPETLLPVYLQQAPDPAWSGLPARSTASVEITEGPHFGYALQWFTFAAILGLGYPFFIRKSEAAPQPQERPHEKPA
jgi:surfeit locus 1 family protein